MRIIVILLVLSLPFLVISWDFKEQKLVVDDSLIAEIKQGDGGAIIIGDGGSRVGEIKDEGNRFAIYDGHKKEKGSLTNEGEVYDEKGNLIYTVKIAEGRVYDKNGDLAFSINKTGRVYNSRGDEIARILNYDKFLFEGVMLVVFFSDLI
ncbi:MAG: hypothetical protein B6D57_04390 [Candidatus Coatesbacteria bacterium 4484_99]|uniref:Uncharacterized protein n=1 Tax=Candidatus Coatesbacteria bacterium 4484_99 TaxID=1970774 RepID=A0A1W9S028_9BACT|nr:MAG: hypothetical protein B6D57_04390 [Candidatus Coatesbacteria bacterium 4484_99]RLC44622.1 MAG: hypothetical protein DRH44_01705 [Candidatus Coatesbacteria bacterium]